ncbi:hypothetical protein [Raoultella ornithinolytica]|uniref:hypothetical protein n=1 Tax=Raoultella ornithinolytica TaxID=54291 RepID=UPI00301CF1C2
MTITAAERALFPHSKLLLPRAVEALTMRLQQQDPHHLGVTPRELIDMFDAGSIAMCYDWGSSGLVVPEVDGVRELNAYYLSNITPEEIPALLMHQYGGVEAPAVKKIPHGSPYDPYEYDLEDFTWEKMVLPQPEVVKAYRLLNPVNLQPQEENKSAHGNTEHHASNREHFYKVAIAVLSDHPDECRGTRKECSPAKWRDAMLKYANEYPPTLTGSDTIEKHLAAAVNMRQRAKVKGG